MNEHNQTSPLTLLDPWCILNNLLRELWMIVAGGVIGFFAASILLLVAFPNSYGSRATFIVFPRNAASAYQSASLANSMAETMSEVFSSPLVQQDLIASAGLEQFDGSISVSSQTDSNLITITVTSSSTSSSFRVMQALTMNQSELTRYIFNGAAITPLSAATTYVIPAFKGNPGHFRLAGALVGALAVIALLLVMQIFQDTVQNASAARHKLDARLLQTIPHEDRFGSRTLWEKVLALLKLAAAGLLPFLRKKQEAAGSAAPLMITDPTVSFDFVESIHSLRAALEQQKQSSGSNTFLITSVSPHEGKTSLAENLALSLAQKHENVLIVDCDFRKTSVYSRYTAGWEVTNQFKVAQYTLNLSLHRQTGLVALYSPERMPAPSEFLASDAFVALLQRVGPDYSYMLIDTPPLDLFSDAERLTELEASCLLVTRQDLVPAPVVNDAIDTLRRQRAHFMGCVLNDVHRLPLPALDALSDSRYGKYNKYNRYDSSLQHYHGYNGSSREVKPQ